MEVRPRKHRHADALNRAIAEIDTEVEANLDPFRPLIPLLTGIPGIGAVAASSLTATYHMISTGTYYQDLGAGHFERRAKPAQAKRLIAKLQSLGYDVQSKTLTA